MKLNLFLRRLKLSTVGLSFALLLFLFFQNCSQYGFSTNGDSSTVTPANSVSANPTPGPQFTIAYPKSLISNRHHTKIEKMLPSFSNMQINEQVQFWSISPQLPAGLSFNLTTGEISGTNPMNFARQSFSIQATSSLSRLANTTIEIESLPLYSVVKFSNTASRCAIVKPTNAVRCSGYLFGAFPPIPGRTNNDQTVEIQGTSGAMDVSSTQQMACAVMNTGHVRCWGQNSNGQLGNGANQDSLASVEVLGISNAVKVSMGFYSVCALLADQTIWCWGQNGQGQLGIGSNISSSSIPLQVIGITNAIDISSLSYNSCALLNGGNIKCWGANGAGQLGSGSASNSSFVPIEVVGIADATQVSVSGASNFGCAVLATGKVKCWGDNRYVKFTDPLIQFVSTPVEMSTLSDVKAISSGTQKACALKNDNSVYCWGSMNQTLDPVFVFKSDSIQSLSLGDGFAAVMKDGSVISGDTAAQIHGVLDY